MLSSLKGALFLFLFISVTLADPASVGYYLDKSYNLVQVPILELPLYLKNSSVIGVSSFFNHLNTSGWTYLQIETNPSFSDYQQMYAAGYLEGSSTYELIWDAWNNFNEFMLNNASFVSSKAQAFVNNQTNWILQTVQANPEDPYWNLVNASLAQQDGLYDGYVNQIQKANRTDMSLTYDQFYYLTNMGDLEDIIPAFNVSVKKSMECSAFFRLTEDDLIAAHSTFNIYSLMLRVFKSYHIPLNNPLVKVKTLMFSSRPGDLESKDDFYMLDNGLVVVETSLNNFNVSLYNDIHYAALPAWMRNLMANRIAGSGEEWAEYFFMNRSGTHNNQWIVLDYNKYDTYKNNITSAEGIVWMIEEYYSLQSAIDVTQELLVSQGYVAGYNVPYNQSIYNISGYTTGYGYNYTTDPRAVLFKKYGPETETIGSVKDLMRYNNVNDTGDVCSAIAPRCDLLDKGAFIFGAIDGKVTNRELMKTMVSHIVSGPTTENLPAFNWDHWPDTAHRGMPPLFDFDWLLYKAIVGPLSIDEDIISI